MKKDQSKKIIRVCNSTTSNVGGPGIKSWAVSFLWTRQWSRGTWNKEVSLSACSRDLNASKYIYTAGLSTESFCIVDLASTRYQCSLGFSLSNYMPSNDLIDEDTRSKCRGFYQTEIYCTLIRHWMLYRMEKVLQLWCSLLLCSKTQNITLPL